MKKQFRRAGALMLALLMLMTAAPPWRRMRRVRQTARR